MTFFNLYIIVLPAIFYVARICKWNNLPFFILILLAIIRYDTVSDYYSYIDIFAQIRQNSVEWFVYEPLFHLLNLLFSFTSRGYIIVIIFCTIIPYVALYTQARKYQVFYWSTLFFYLFGYITKFDNIMRQDVAIGLFILSIPYAMRNNLFKFSMCNLLGLGFHYTAFVCFIFYPLLQYARKAEIRFYRYLFLAILLFFLVLSGCIFQIFSFILSHLPFWGDYVIFLDFFKNEDKPGLGALFRIMIWLLPIFIYRHDKNEDIRLLVFMFFISLLIEIVCSDFSFLVRIANYLFVFPIILLAILFTNVRWRLSIICKPIIFLFFFYTNARNVISYYGTENIFYTILSENARHFLVYERQANRNLWWDEELVKDRNKLIRYEP